MSTRVLMVLLVVKFDHSVAYLRRRRGPLFVVSQHLYRSVFAGPFEQNFSIRAAIFIVPVTPVILLLTISFLV